MLEEWFDGLTRSQLIFFEQYWRDNGPQETSARAHWEALQRTHERRLKAKQRRFRKESVTIWGHKVVVHRDRRTGRFVRIRRRLRR